MEGPAHILKPPLRAFLNAEEQQLCFEIFSYVCAPQPSPALVLSKHLNNY